MLLHAVMCQSSAMRVRVHELRIRLAYGRLLLSQTDAAQRAHADEDGLLQQARAMQAVEFLTAAACAGLRACEADTWVQLRQGSRWVVCWAPCSQARKVCSS